MNMCYILCWMSIPRESQGTTELDICHVHPCHIHSELWGCLVFLTWVFLDLVLLTPLTITNYPFHVCTFCCHHAKLLCCSSSLLSFGACETAGIMEGLLIRLSKQGLQGRLHQSPPSRHPAQLHTCVLRCCLHQVFYKQSTPSHVQ